jgi:N-acetyl-anhydromuramyl-L-alanine amidase AmpD
MAREILQIGCHAGNFRPGRQGFRPKAIVIHIITGSQKGCDSWFNNPASGVSAHYSVGKHGEIHQYVDTEDCAFHAGVVALPSWTGVEREGTGQVINPNLYTLGIEHEGKPDDEWTEDMYASSAWLVRMLAEKYDIPLDRNHIIGHREIRATKTCPGPKVDLNKLIDQAAAVPAAEFGGSDARNAEILVKTVSNANLRRGSASRQAPIVRTIPAGTTLTMAGFIRDGESVKENSAWYHDRNGNFLWAGTTDKPQP